MPTTDEPYNNHFSNRLSDSLLRRMPHGIPPDNNQKRYIFAHTVPAPHTRLRLSVPLIAVVAAPPARMRSSLPLELDVLVAPARRIRQQNPLVQRTAAYPVQRAHIRH